MQHFDTFFQHYLIAALWSSTDDNGDPLDDNYAPEDIHSDDVDILRAHALSFFSRCWFYILEEKEEFAPHGRIAQAGHDFWLTSQGHGSGFWDGDWPVYGELLTKLSKCYPEELHLMPDDDGTLRL